jgi:hypothetical protein
MAVAWKVLVVEGHYCQEAEQAEIDSVLLGSLFAG